MTNTNYCRLAVCSCKLAAERPPSLLLFFFLCRFGASGLYREHMDDFGVLIAYAVYWLAAIVIKNMVYIQCHTMLRLCHGWRRKTTLAGLNLWASSAPRLPFFFQYNVNHLTNREQQSKPLLQALVTKRNDCSYCQSVLLMYSAPTGLADNRKAGGNSVALCCLRLIYIGNKHSLALSHTLWCDFTVVTLIQAHFDLALSCCSFSLPPAITLCSLVARLCSF